MNNSALRKKRRKGAMNSQLYLIILFESLQIDSNPINRLKDEKIFLLTVVFAVKD